MRGFKIAGVLLLLSASIGMGDAVPYPIVDTGQVRCYDDRQEIEFPRQGQAFFGQDAHYQGNIPSYKNNEDGTVSDLVTGLMWTSDPGEKQTLSDALSDVKRCQTAGYNDWRVPTIKELYSLIQFTGTDPDPMTKDTSMQKPFIDTQYFKFQYGDLSKGERIIDSQYGSCTKYVSTTMGNSATMFGVNFGDGRIKGYPIVDPRSQSGKRFYFIYVRSNPQYGQNQFKDNGDGTITDAATGLTWMQMDSGYLKGGEKGDGRLNWSEALEWAEDLSYAGKSDWRLPNAKELQSIVDYTRSPKTSQSPAINPIFKVSQVKDEGGGVNYPFYWSSSTHASMDNGSSADYIAFGEALGFMEDKRTGSKTLMDVHGAGAQRSDPKSGDPSRFPQGRGPQGDVIRIYNYVLCVRGGKADPVTSGPPVEMEYRERGEKDMQGPPEQDGGRNGFMQKEDKNRDGKVSKSEFGGPKNHFSQLDKNGDGYISADEAPSGPPEPQPGGERPAPRRK